jgi:hypothetical protein
MKLYYFEIYGDRFLGQHDYETLCVVMEISNAKFFEVKKRAKIWYDKIEKEFPGAELWSFEAVNWKREE